MTEIAVADPAAPTAPEKPAAPAAPAAPAEPVEPVAPAEPVAAPVARAEDQEHAGGRSAADWGPPAIPSDGTAPAPADVTEIVAAAEV